MLLAFDISLFVSVLGVSLAFMVALVSVTVWLTKFATKNEAEHAEFRASIINIDKKFDKIDQKFDKIDQKFDKIDKKFDKIDQKFDKIDAKFEKMEEKFEARFSAIERSISAIVTTLSELKAHVFPNAPNDKFGILGKSPLDLSDYGKELQVKLQLSEKIDRNWHAIYSQIKSKNPNRNPYDIQQICLSMTIVDLDIIFQEQDLEELKLHAYKKGESLTISTDVLAILIRDRYFEVENIIPPK